MGVTATLYAFSDPWVKVGTADTATASVANLGPYNPPVPPEDEATLGTSYYWSATVDYKCKANHTFALAATSKYTLTYSAQTDKSTTITVTPKVAGYWKVTASCQVSVGQLVAGSIASNTKLKTAGTAAASGTPLAWVGTGTTSSQYFTSAIVSFSPSPILTGADKSDPGAVYTKVVATVAPAALAQSVSVDKYVPLPGGTGNAQTGTTVTRNTTNGTITFDVGGTAGTAPSMPKGDLQLEAKEGGTVLGTDMVIVQIPKAIGRTHVPVGKTSVVSQADCILSKAFLARRIFSIIFSALAVHVKALGWALWAAM